MSASRAAPARNAGQGSTRMQTTVTFDKMVGAGNDFLIVDARRTVPPAIRRAWSRIAKAMCDRRYGVGADGLLVLEASPQADARMRVFNADGSEAEMCGNGARCVVRYIGRTRKGSRGQVRLQTQAGILTAALAGARVRLQLSTPTEIALHRTLDVDDRTLEIGFANTGVPHAIVPVDAVDQVDVATLGRQLRYHAAFAPRGANVNFVERIGERKLRVRTYERGVEGETLACGTGVTAAAVLDALWHPARGSGPVRVQVETRSGEVLTVEVTVETSGGAPRVTQAILEGTARWICQGQFVWPQKDPR